MDEEVVQNRDAKNTEEMNYDQAIKDKMREDCIPQIVQALLHVVSSQRERKPETATAALTA